MWDTLASIPLIIPIQAQQPDAITRKLKSFQLEGLNWMTRQEESQWKGGLLGDEMGMGKTIQAVSLIMSDHPAKHPTLVMYVEPHPRRLNRNPQSQGRVELRQLSAGDPFGNSTT